MGTNACKYEPQLPSTTSLIELQDLKSVIPNASTSFLSYCSILTQIYDFPTPQPVRGTRFHLKESVRHGRYDAGVRCIRQRVAAAVEHGSSALLSRKNAARHRPLSTSECY